MRNVQGGLLSVAVINAIYNIIAQVIGKSSRHHGGIDPIVFSTYRDAAACPILYCIALSQGRHQENRRSWWPNTKADVARIALQGFLGIYMNQLLFLLGVELTNGTTGSICNLTLPVFAAAIGMCTGREKFKWSTILGVCLAIFGAFCMKVGTGTAKGDSLLGIVVLLVGSFASAVYYIIQKETLKRYGAVLVTSWEYFFGFGFMALSAVLFADYGGESWRLSKIGVIALTFAVLFNSVLKYLLNSICNKYVSATVLTAWSTIVPVFTAALSFILLKEPLHLSYLGSLPVMLGIWIVMAARETTSSTTGKASPASYKHLVESEQN
ncbi:hypothetical protein HOP50_10g60450 [Chloropicon primus]|nr:hypothetical protein HOP50_10g60450 [Chloropicon primus]